MCINMDKYIQPNCPDPYRYNIDDYILFYIDARVFGWTDEEIDILWDSRVRCAA